MGTLNERHILELIIFPLSIVAVYLTLRFGFAWDIGWEIGELVFLGLVCWLSIVKSIWRIQGRRDSIFGHAFAMLDRACALFVWKIQAAVSPAVRTAFSEHLFTIAAKITIADGVTSWEEARAIRELLRDKLHLTNDQELRANAAFQAAKHDGFSLEESLLAFKAFAGNNRAICESLLELLVPLAATEEGYSAETVDRLRAAQEILAVDKRDFAKMLGES